MVEVEIFTTGPLKNNTYLVFNSESQQGILIDPSFEVRTILGFLDQEKIKLEFLLLTHGHYDHIIGVSEVLKFLTYLKVALHPDDLMIVRDFSLEKSKSLGINLNFTEPQILLTDGQKFRRERLNFEVIHTPGHTPGGVCFYFKENKMIFTGDTLFKNAIGRTDLIGGDKETLLKSIKEKLLVLPPETEVYPGHGQPTDILKEREYLQQPYKLE